MRKSKRIYVIKLCILAGLVLALALISLCFGTVNYSLDQVFKVLLKMSNTGAFIITRLRLPRIYAAILCGLAFGIAGNIFQTLLNNPLASPDIIGVSSGSTVAAVYCILFLRLNRNLVSFISVIAGIVVALVIYKISYRDKFSTNRLILVGIGFQAFFSALTNWMIMKAAEYDVPTAMRWLNGNLNGIVTESLPMLFIVVIVCGLTVIGFRHSLQSIALGEQIAVIHGVRVNRVRALLIICAVMLIAFATAIAGPIASIAFLSGPIAARICGRNQSNILSSGLVGAILVLAGDFVGENLLATRYPVGVVTGILGAPYLIYLLIYQHRKGKA